MTIDRPAPLTPEEFAALLDLAFGAPRRKIASIVLAKLVVLRYIDMTASGPVVTGDGLIRLNESRSDGSENPL